MSLKFLCMVFCLNLITYTAVVYANDLKKAEETSKTSINKAVALVIAEADEARKAAAKVGFEWRDTAKLLKKATQAAQAGDDQKALKLAKKAKHQGEMGLKQAELSKTAQPHFFK